MKSALITGSSTGIGRETALHLAARGWRVFAGVRKDADARSLADEAASRRLPGRIDPLTLDVTDQAHIAAAASSVASAVGSSGLHALINNAGIPVVGPVEAVPLDRWRRQFDVNFFGHIAVTQACLPMLRAARGRIVLVSSIAGLIGQPFLSPYSASKHALEALGDALRIELAPEGVGVTLVEPGAIQTPIWKRGEENTKSVQDAMPAELSARYARRLERVKQMALDAEAKGLPASACAAVIERAITARRAPARIILGADARIGAFFKRLLPARLFDVVLRRAFGV